VPAPLPFHSGQLSAVAAKPLRTISSIELFESFLPISAHNNGAKTQKSFDPRTKTKFGSDTDFSTPQMKKMWMFFAECCGSFSSASILL
jgi:hypothetical protein